MVRLAARSAGAHARFGAAVPPLTEAAFQRQVVELARDLGWGVSIQAWRKEAADAEAFGVEPGPLAGLVFHPHFSVGSEPGWPDLTLVRRRDRRLVFAELKSDKGRLHPRQEAVLELLRSLVTAPFRVGDVEWQMPRIEVFVWRPADMDRIAEVLR